MPRDYEICAALQRKGMLGSGRTPPNGRYIILKVSGAGGSYLAAGNPGFLDGDEAPGWKWPAEENWWLDIELDHKVHREWADHLRELTFPYVICALKMEYVHLTDRTPIVMAVTQDTLMANLHAKDKQLGNSGQPGLDMFDELVLQQKALVSWAHMNDYRVMTPTQIKSLIKPYAQAAPLTAVRFRTMYDFITGGDNSIRHMDMILRRMCVVTRQVEYLYNAQIGEVVQLIGRAASLLVKDDVSGSDLYRASKKAWNTLKRVEFLHWRWVSIEDVRRKQIRNPCL
jgi:hypothetical protein